MVESKFSLRIQTDYMVEMGIFLDTKLVGMVERTVYVRVVKVWEEQISSL